jgi:hypothetical protein
MGIKRSMRIYVVSFIIIAALFLGFVIEAKAETMKCRSVGVLIKVEAMPVADVENHTLGFAIREGLAFFDNGETANYRAQSIWDVIQGKSTKAYVYNFFTFEDGSKIITKIEQDNVADASGKLTASKATGEILKGTGRFEGIKGNCTVTGKTFPAPKGESGKSTMDFIFNYTLQK